MALTERLDILINASGSKAVAEFGKVGKAASTEMGKAERAGGMLDSRLGSIGAQAKAGLAAGLSVGAGALVSFGKSAVNAATDLGEQQSATNVIFKSGAGIVQDYAKTTATSLGISRRAALEAANGFGDLFQNVGFSDKASAGLSTGLVQLAGDLASFKNLGTEDVLAKLKSGLTGEAEPLKALGILINETAVKSKAMEMGLGGAHRELTEGEKVAARYALMIDKTKNAQGDAARTADSLANKTRQLNAQTEDAMANLGQNLAPTMGLLAGKASQALTAVDKLAGQGGGAGGGIAALANEVVKSQPGLHVLDGLIGHFGKTSGNTADTTDKLRQAQALLGEEGKGLADKTMTLAQAQGILEEATAKAAKELDKQRAGMLSALGAELGYEQSLNSLEDAAQDVADAQRDLTLAVQEHGRNSIEAKQAAEALSRAQLGLRGDVLSAAEAFAKQAEQNALANGKQWNAVEAARAQIAGLEDMKKKYPELQREIDAYIAKLSQIPGVITTQFVQSYHKSSTGARMVDPDGKNRNTAEGGIFNGAQLRVIGEAGPEAVIPLSASKRQRAAALMQQSGLVGGWADGGIVGRGWTGAGGGAVTNSYSITVNAGLGGDKRAIGQEVVEAIVAFERGNGKAWRSA